MKGVLGERAISGWDRGVFSGSQRRSAGSVQGDPGWGRAEAASQSKWAMRNTTKGARVAAVASAGVGGGHEGPQFRDKTQGQGQS